MQWRYYANNRLTSGLLTIHPGTVGKAGVTRTSCVLHHVLGLRLPLALIHYQADKAYTFKHEVIRRLRTLPGVESVSLAKGQGLVWTSGQKVRATLPGKTYAKPEEEPSVSAKPVAPDYFTTLRIPFVSGRDFNDFDKFGSQPVAIVNQTFARQITANFLPLGQTILLNDKPYQIEAWSKMPRYVALSTVLSRLHMYRSGKTKRCSKHGCVSAWPATLLQHCRWFAKLSPVLTLKFLSRKQCH